MDSLTQMALGAAVAESTLGKKIGRKATLWGAVAGTFPDLDVFIPMGGPVADFTHHRSFSHSIFILLLVTPLWTYVFSRIHKKAKVSRSRISVAIYLVFLTHVLLDCFTVYGTQVFWPVSDYPVSIGSVFIIDPLYSAPLIIGLCVYLWKRESWAQTANVVGIILSTFYLLWTLSAQVYVCSLAAKTVPNDSRNGVLVTPTPFNSLLWRVVTVAEDRYYVGYYSFFDTARVVRFQPVKSYYAVLETIADEPSVRRLEWFTHGFYAVDLLNQRIVISDIRMGIEPDYVFSFAVAEFWGGVAQPIPPRVVRGGRDISRLKRVWARIWNDSIII